MNKKRKRRQATHKKAKKKKLSVRKVECPLLPTRILEFRQTSLFSVDISEADIVVCETAIRKVQSR